jgi:two-component system response regulator (stage 0 sporulation protein F)
MARILVVEDDEQIRGLMREILEREKHTVFEAADGMSGVGMFKEVQPDLVISDLIMPGKDGIMIIQELLSIKAGAKIIAMSGGATGKAAWLPIAIRAGAMKVIKKPFAKAQLVESVTEAMHSY